MKITAAAIAPLFREAGFADYAIHDIDDQGDDVYPKYFGSAHNSGAVLIMKQVDAGTFRYFVSREGYEVLWTGRGDLEFKYIFELDLDE